MQHTSGTDEPERRNDRAGDAWEVLREALDDIGQKLARRGDCGEAGRLLGRVAHADLALHQLERALQGIHLACCVFPNVCAPGEVAQALAHLSARRTGALLVFEQQDSLDAWATSGTTLDAQLSPSLLETIFYPGNPLHDGAVIVRGSRIAAAGVFLPLAAEHRDSTHGRLLGARHRAALGLTRVTDALVFVVSEETGQISVALGGMLVDRVNVQALSPNGAEPPGAAEGESRTTRTGWLARLRTWLDGYCPKDSTAGCGLMPEAHESRDESGRVDRRADALPRGANVDHCCWQSSPSAHGPGQWDRKQVTLRGIYARGTRQGIVLRGRRE